VTAVEGAGVELAYEERGAGQAVVLVHGVGCPRALWDETVAALGDPPSGGQAGFRTIAYDRRGYGESGEPEDYRRTTVEEHADDLIALLRALDAAPALLCGLSFASMACLDAMLREPALVRAAVLVEPPLLWLADGGAEAMSGMRKAVEDGAAAGGPAAAIDAFATYVCGPQALDLLGRDRVEAAHRSPRAFGADLGASWSAPTRALRGIEAPVTIVVGERSQEPWHEAAAGLAEMLPQGELVKAEGSGHLVPIEAPGVLAEALRALAQP
jgi:pimeloyl-ACP methyl ester carboxylesterase